MPAGTVPRRILNVRRLDRYDNLWDTVRYRIMDGRRTLRKWLADPTVSDELRKGDAELLARLEAHLVERVPPRIHYLSREEAEEILAAMLDAEGQTLH